MRLCLRLEILLFWVICFAFTPSPGACLEWIQYSVRSGQTGPVGRKFHAFGFDMIRQFLVVFGGIGAAGTVLNDTWVLDVAAGRWYEVKYGNYKPDGRYGAVYGMYNGQLIVSTGCDLKQCYDDIWSFNAASFLWTRIQPDGFLRPKPRGHASGGIFLYGKTLVASGGLNLDGEYFSDTFVFDLAQNRWHQMEAWQSVYDPSLPHPRAHESSVMIDESTLLTFGGCIKHGICPSAASWTFDSQVSKWKQLRKCAMARTDGAMAVTSFNNVPYAILFGGNTKGRQTIGSTSTLKANEIAVFDIKSSTWSVRLVEGVKLPGNRVGAALASTGRVLYLFGGEISGRCPNDVYILTGDPNSALIVPCGEAFFTLVSLHALFMFLGFAVLLQVGGAIAQYATIIRAPLSISWRYIHKVLQVLGLIFVSAAFICGILVIPDGHYHFQSVHGSLGMFVFALLLVQAFLGFLSLHNRALRPLMLLVHFWLGAAILLLAYINISLGLFLAMSPTALWIAWFVYVLLVCGIGCFMLAYDCCKEKRLLNRMMPPTIDLEMDKRDDVYSQQDNVGYISHPVISYMDAGY